ncbi:MAG: hypothetical protein AVDCRST_MAG28-10, partial [uncultured Rubrobacteraceae bacterium]
EAKLGATLVQSHGWRVRGRGFDSRRLHCFGLVLRGGPFSCLLLCRSAPSAHNGVRPGGV